ncbi:MAG: aspartate aminotransferase family protein [Rhodospirillales bacterium]|jgi:hypothetical protein|nr:aspartate aminotransferase family protein [Rhodospirillaceae bacterium]MDP6426642.1 aspartate aminotransferase family protein [Rhodospirillales bacterium]MDP6643211.1 aspartate aminotransferase family protein [Rhodospirillales bacterium]|tara:strand:+ start:517 stop:1848 length:1332 start_codon:yes stop_codon:yes gene_type:complete
MSRIFHRQISQPLPEAVGGDGIYLIDSTGKRYIDASGGAAVSCLGHNDPDINAAIKDQADCLAFAHTFFFTSRPAEELADLLIRDAPEGIERVYFASGGSEATEGAVKLARQYFLEIGEPERHHIIARHQSYHGNTLGALAIGGNEGRRRQFEPLLIDAHHIPPCYAYRLQRPDESAEDYGRRAADALETTIEDLGPATVAAFIAETVVGATTGAVPPVTGYFKRIRDICDRHGVLLILDEVMCGIGRTGTLHACEQEGIAPDILTIAKGLAAGYQPLSAVLLAGKIYDAVARGSGVLMHGHTFMGHPTACAAALAVLSAIHERGLITRVQAQGEVFAELLRARFADHPFVGDIRGRGLLLGLELVADRDAKSPFDPGARVHARIKAEAMARGLICYPIGGTADGVVGDHVLLAPPYIVTTDELAEISDRLVGAIDAATVGLA